MKILYIALIISTVNCLSFDDNFNPDILLEDNKELAAKDEIFHGEIVAINTVPYLAQVLKDKEQICAASIISNQWLVSAAHCFKFDYIYYSIITGSCVRGKGELHEIDKIIVHEDYDSITEKNDIALIKLKDIIKFNKDQKPIKVGNLTPTPGVEMKIAGFGRVGKGLPSSLELRSAVVPVMSLRECKERYVNFIDLTADAIKENMFCTGTGESGVCQGDSGGPAVLNNKLVGVVSFIKECASKNVPAIYTRINLYRSWIMKLTGLKLKS